MLLKNVPRKRIMNALMVKRGAGSKCLEKKSRKIAEKDTVKRRKVKFIAKNVKRARRKKIKNISTCLRVMGVNSAGILSKLPTFTKSRYSK